VIVRLVADSKRLSPNGGVRRKTVLKEIFWPKKEGLATAEHYGHKVEIPNM
jgi:hypothetical protein